MASRSNLPDATTLLHLSVCTVLCASVAHAQADVPMCPVSPGEAPQRVAPNNVRLVTGAPYSALGTSETVTTLADGNRIVRQNSVRLWRDSDGRTRAEYSLSSIGGPLPFEVNSTVTVIDDPAAGTRYLLQPGQKEAVAVPIAACRAPVEGEPDFVGPVRAPGSALAFSGPQRLGERTVDGEKVAGSRIEATIPAGAIGN